MVIDNKKYSIHESMLLCNNMKDAFDYAGKEVRIANAFSRGCALTDCIAVQTPAQIFEWVIFI